MSLRYGSVCSGIEAATVAWHSLGWEPSFFSEIEAFPRAVLSHHYPHVPLHGDFTTIKGDQYDAIDLLVGGTPCQSFSVAGLRGGLADDRGNLALEYLRMADRLQPRWLVWENVPGVLSSYSCPEPPSDLAEGQEWEAIETSDFGCFLDGLRQLGYGFAYRVLDAQHFGVPQRRRRVFVVGYLGDWRRATAVLFERHSLQGHPAPRREKGQVAPTVPSRSSAGGGLGTDFDCDGGLIAKALTAHGGPHGRLDAESETFVTAPPITSNPYGDHESREGLLVAHSLRGEGFDASEDGTGRGTPLVPVAFDCKASGQNGFGVGEVMGTLRSMGHSNSHQNGGGHAAVATASAVRRLTPRECERLQGFPDDYTLVPVPKVNRHGTVTRRPLAKDGPRYKALGNSMAVPVMHWIGQRIQQVEAITQHTILEAAE